MTTISVDQFLLAELPGTTYRNRPCGKIINKFINIFEIIHLRRGTWHTVMILREKSPGIFNHSWMYAIFGSNQNHRKMSSGFFNNDIESERTDKKTGIQKIIDLKFLEQRKIFLWGPVDDESARDIVSKLLYLESINPNEKITFFIDSPGGVVSSGFSIVDTMYLISSPVSTVCMGMAASMGSILLSAGAKGERYIFPLGEVMIHQPSIGMMQGSAADLQIQARQIAKTKEISAGILAKNCNQSAERILKDFDRDHWMDARESIEYGIVDKVFSMK